jgi:lambda family phage portal protein
VFQWAKSLFGLGSARPAAAPSGTFGAPGTNALLGQYDNAQTSAENQRNWWNTDYLSAKAANSFAVRRVLRMRSRYETANNPWLFGVTNNNADDLISHGPTLQITTDNAKWNRDVEAKFLDWAHEVDLTEKLRTCKLAKTIDGEGFLVFRTVEDLESKVKLYPVDIEADQVTTPAPQNVQEMFVDGITLHPITQRPTKYTILNAHPGDFYFPELNPLAAKHIAAEFVVHWFPKFRPGQCRGVPVLTPSLDVAAELRSFRKAVLQNVQISADYAAVFETEFGTANTGTDAAEQGYRPFQRVALNRGQGAFLPPGAKMQQLKPEHPTTTYGDFSEKCLSEKIRPLSYPLNLALGSSQKFNFSSAKLDHINYRETLSVERKECERVVLRKIFAAWYHEAVLCGLIQPYDGFRLPPHAWHWPAFSSLDPLVDAQANALLIANGQLTLSEFWAQKGKDWRDVLQQLHTEAEELAKLDLKFGDVVQRTVSDTATEPEPEAANAA